MKHCLVNKPQFALVGAVSVAALAWTLLTGPAFAVKPIKPPTDPDPEPPPPTTTTAAYTYINLGPRGANAGGINDAGIVRGSFPKQTDQGRVNSLFLVIPKDNDNDGKPDTWYEDLNADGANDLLLDLESLEAVVEFPTDSDENGELDTMSFTEVLAAYGPILAMNDRNQILTANYILTPAENQAGGPDFSQWTTMAISFDDLPWFQVNGLNNVGQVIGSAYVDDNQVGFIYDTRTGWIDLLGYVIDRYGAKSPLLPNAINDSGEIAASGPGNYENPPCLIRPLANEAGQLTWCVNNDEGLNALAIRLIEVNSSTWAYVTAISPNGKVVGWSNGKQFQPLLWEVTQAGRVTTTKLPTLNRGGHWGNAMNGSDVIVGYTSVYKQTGMSWLTIVSWDAYVIQNGVIKNLAAMTDQADALKDMRLSANDINEAGHIVGCKEGSYPWELMTIPEGDWHAFIAVPVKK